MPINRKTTKKCMKTSGEKEKKREVTMTTRTSPTESVRGGRGVDETVNKTRKCQGK